jgi:hypothetical protein
MIWILISFLIFRKDSFLLPSCHKRWIRHTGTNPSDQPHIHNEHFFFIFKCFQILIEHFLHGSNLFLEPLHIIIIEILHLALGPVLCRELHKPSKILKMPR